STALLISVWPENSIRNMRRRAFRPDDAPGHRRDPAHAEDARPDADGPRQARGSVTVHRREGREAPDEPELRHRPADHERARIRVEDVMDPPFPQIDAKAPVELAAGLLRHYNAVIVVSRGDITGIVTKSDLMKLL